MADAYDDPMIVHDYLVPLRTIIDLYGDEETIRRLKSGQLGPIVHQGKKSRSILRSYLNGNGKAGMEHGAINAASPPPSSPDGTGGG